MTIRYRARDGEPIATLARRVGLSRQTVYHHLARTTAAPAHPAPSLGPRPSTPSATISARGYTGA